jgi:hypothetical protein
MPLPILVIFNSMLLYRTLTSGSQFDKSRTDRTKKRLLSFTVIMSTTVFIVLNTPNCVVNGFYFTKVVEGPNGFTMSFIFFALQFTYSSLNLFCLLVSNKAFLRQITCDFLLKRLDPTGKQTQGNTKQAKLTTITGNLTA